MQTYEEHLAKSRECNKRTHDERIRWGLCIRCGKPLTDETTLQCKACLQRQAERREQTSKEDRERQRRRIEAHRAQGMCVHCSAPAVEGETRCEYHKRYHRVIGQKKQKRWSDEQ